MAQTARPLPYRSTLQRRKHTSGGRVVAWLLSWLVGLAAMAGVVGWRYAAAHEGRIWEGVSVNGVALGGLAPDEAAALLRARLPAVGDERLVLSVAGERWVASATDLGIQLDAAATAQAAFRQGREGSSLARWATRFALWRGAGGQGQLQPLRTRDPVAVEAMLTRIANEVARDPRDAALTVQGLSVSAIPELPGRQLDLNASRERLLAALTNNERAVELAVQERAPHIVGADAAAERARALLAAPLALAFDQPTLRLDGATYQPATERRQWTIDRARLADLLLVFSEPLPNGQVALNVRLKPEELQAEVAAIAATIAREPRDARFDYDPNTGALTPLVISQEGLRLDEAATLAAIQSALAAGQHEIALPVTTIQPRVATTDAAKFNISGLAVDGFSDYTGSSAEREVNLSVAASQFHGLVIPPGSTFSFNEHLGWVVDATGYEEGYIISGNETQVDVGGGVCQVSTTVFRAAFNAGFEIVERHPHAYRVPYYENGSPLGWDATVFSPIVDFKFRNNTENFYLMEVANNRDANTLAINLYGQPTGRVVEIVSTVTDTQPEPPPLYTDDPALPAGTTKQVDWAHPGATIRVDRIIRDTAGNELGRDAFWSEYRPWQARYLVGTGR